MVQSRFRLTPEQGCCDLVWSHAPPPLFPYGFQNLLDLLHVFLRVMPVAVQCYPILSEHILLLVAPLPNRRVNPDIHKAGAQITG
jgi:hypothetical protein